MYKIGNIRLKNNLILAPMVGINNPAFRLLCQKYNAGLITTGMIHPKSLPSFLKILNLTSEKPISTQLFGSDPKEIAEAAKLIEDKTDIIDLNFGCPSHNVIDQKSGSYLMKYPSKIEKIATKVAESVSCPVTAKIRTGWDKVNALEITKKLENSGISALTIHGRTVKQGYSGKADWNIIKEIKESTTIPIIANGDIYSPEDYIEIEKQTKADFFMIGRGSLGNPIIFENCLRLKKGKKQLEKNPAKLFEEYIELPHQKEEARQFALWLTKGLENSNKIRNEIAQIKDLKKIKLKLSNAVSNTSNT